MAGRGYDYLDRISAGLKRNRFGVPSVSAQLSTLSASERAAYDDCLKGYEKPLKANKANKAKAIPSVVAMLKESKEFVVPKAGMRIQPEGRHIPSKPAIISTDKDRQEFDFVLGGQNVHLRFVAQRYEADLGDGGPVLSQAGKPVPYPEALKGSFYRNFVKEGSFVVTLRTYWQVEWFNPATGQWVVEAELMVSEEKSQPQLVKPYNYVLTDDAEQEHGR
ncbi:hypothetical protein BM477_06615 [Boudabousia marimammalium]|uniref:Uncharacterized protein n=2 Tax=Boudabousia marimammalium TaxID=156892 RepID=A0A1Q5PL25_9ACTO|nr:hypothetical protein BM477_06615 [Boudabousia marimammalium]